MSDYTPTTEEVRTKWVESNTDASFTVRMHVRAAFDRWLDAHDGEMRADQIEKDAAIAEAEAATFESEHEEGWPAFNLNRVAAIIRA